MSSSSVDGSPGPSNSPSPLRVNDDTIANNLCSESRVDSQAAHAENALDTGASTPAPSSSIPAPALLSAEDDVAADIQADGQTGILAETTPSLDIGNGDTASHQPLPAVVVADNPSSAVDTTALEDPAGSRVGVEDAMSIMTGSSDDDARPSLSSPAVAAAPAVATNFPPADHAGASKCNPGTSAAQIHAASISSAPSAAIGSLPRQSRQPSRPRPCYVPGTRCQNNNGFWSAARAPNAAKLLLPDILEDMKNQSARRASPEVTDVDHLISAGSEILTRTFDEVVHWSSSLASFTQLLGRLSSRADASAACRELYVLSQAKMSTLARQLSAIARAAESAHLLPADCSQPSSACPFPSALSSSRPSSLPSALPPCFHPAAVSAYFQDAAATSAAFQQVAAVNSERSQAHGASNGLGPAAGALVGIGTPVFPEFADGALSPTVATPLDPRVPPLVPLQEREKRTHCPRAPLCFKAGCRGGPRCGKYFQSTADPSSPKESSVSEAPNTGAACAPAAACAPSVASAASSTLGDDTSPTGSQLLMPRNKKQRTLRTHCPKAPLCLKAGCRGGPNCGARTNDPSGGLDTNAVPRKICPNCMNPRGCAPGSRRCQILAARMEKYGVKSVNHEKVDDLEPADDKPVSCARCESEACVDGSLCAIEPEEID